MSGKNILTKELLGEWHPKDPEWLAVRQQQWLRVENLLLNCVSWFSKSEMKRLQEYFFKGKLTIVDEYELSVSLPMQLAWHPSKDPEVWRRHFDWVLSSIPEYQVEYEVEKAYDEFDNFILLDESGAYDPVTTDPNQYRGREAELFVFFHCAPLAPVLEERFSKSGSQVYRGVYSSYFPYHAYRLPWYVSISLKHTHGVYHEFLPYLGGFLTEASFANRFHNQEDSERMRIVLRDKMVLAQRILMGELQVSPEDFKRIELWREQIAMASPSWQALWQEAEREPVTLSEWEELQEAANPVVAPAPKPREPWPAELAALLAPLAQLGYPCPEETDRDLCSLLRALSNTSEVWFGCFAYDEYDEDDLEAPYEYFAKPLETLCNLAGLAFSYKTRGGFAEFYADKQLIGKIHLDDPEEQYTTDYYRSIVRLAEQHFPEQLFCIGDEFFTLFILPKPVLQTLLTSGFESKPDYFGE